MSENGLDSELTSVPGTEQEEAFAYGCIFCRTGKEKSIAADLCRHSQGVMAIAPSKVLFIRLQGKLVEKESVLFPGYIMVRAEKSYPLTRLARENDVFRVLTTAEGQWQLMGEDEALIQRMFETGGRIGLSKAYYEGDRIRATEGLLKDYEGCIVRVDRRKSKAQVRFQLGNKSILSWLGFEEIK